ncbi:MAG: peptidoglycan DD-metalloendopeptidase family protein, partial [Cellvibrionaceae bacterium]|nr:peptidoglycan DD-metalloendopeptidase family protein [Cellvibrionaceae bacterium]
AYAHNNKLRVKAGDQVKGGQRIADIGSSGADRIKLHFEIRKNGKSVNPLWYLPKR